LLLVLPSTMKVVLLGTAGYHPSDTRHTACFLLPEVGIALDAGSGMFRLPSYLQGDELDIFLSHVHLDHCVGLTYLLSIAAQHPLKRVTVHGEPAKLTALREKLLSEFIFPTPLDCTYEAINGPVPLAGGGTLTSFPLEHPGGSLGFRLDWPGKSLAYVTDTIARPGAPYIEHIRGVDLLLHECNFPDSHRQWADHTGHSHTSAVSQVAREAKVKRLALIHVVPTVGVADPVDVKVAQAIFPNTVLGQDLMELEF